MQDNTAASSAGLRDLDLMSVTILEQIDCALFVTDVNGKIIYNNASGETIANVISGEQPQDDWTHQNRKESMRLLNELDQQVFETGFSQRGELILFVDGQPRVFDISRSPHRDMQGAIVGIIGTARDVTKYRKSELKLHCQSLILEKLAIATPLEEVLQAILTSLENGIPGAMGRFVMVEPDQRCFRRGVTGRVPADFNRLIDGVPIDEVNCPCAAATQSCDRIAIEDIEALATWADFRRQAQAHGLRACFIFPVLSSSTQNKEVLAVCAIYFRAVTKFDEEFNCDIDRISYLACIAIENDRALSARKIAEDRLRESESRLAEAQRVAQMGSWYWEPFTGKVWWSNSMYELFGVDATAVEPSYATFLSLVHPEDRPTAMARVQSILGGEQQFANDLRIVRPDGATIWIYSQARASRDASGKIIRVDGTDQDITERKRAEFSVRDSEERYRLAVLATNDLIWDIDVSTGNMSCSESFIQVFGTPPQDGSVNVTEPWKWWLDRIHPEDRDQTFESLNSAIASQAQFWTSDFRFLRTNGQWADIQKRAYISRDEAGNARRVVGAMQDITSRKRADAELIRTTKLLQAVVNGTTDAVFVKDKDGKYLLFNRAAERLVGRSIEEVIGRDDRSLFEPNDPEYLLRFDRTVMESGEATTAEETLTSKGTTRTYLATKAPYVDESGEVIGLLGISRDITERKKSEQRIATQYAVVTILHQADSLDEAIPAILQSICQYTHWDIGEFWVVDDIDNKLVLAYRWDVSDAQPATFQVREVNRGSELPGRVWASACPASSTFPTDGFDNQGGELTGELVTDGMCSIFGFPIVFANKVLGVATFCSREMREPDNGIMQMFESLGIQIGQFMERKKVERRSALFRTLIDHASDFIEVVDPETGRMIDVNHSACVAHGFSREEYLSLNIADNDVSKSRPFAEILAELHEKRSMRLLSTHRRKDGSEFPVEVNANLIQLDREYLIAIVRDISERTLLEEQLRQSQKMEAIGRLAGGIAHDFNNLLTVINGHTELLLMKSEEKTVGSDHLLAIQQAGERAAGLTAQLLAFSRKAYIEPVVIDINQVIKSAFRLLSRLIREDIVLTFAPTSLNSRIKADPGQIEQCIMNLVVNAKDAMPNGGTLHIKTADVEITPDGAITPTNLAAGSYACVEVIDTGNGMSEEQKHKAFEPFFTTKEVGKGTGLGLAVVHGVMTQCGGTVCVESKLGKGTTFRLFFPVASEADLTTATQHPRSRIRGTETILVVEDEQSVRNVTRIILETHGFRVLLADGGAAAIKIVEEHDEAIDLVITDVVMPHMDGRSVIEALKTIRPNLTTLFISGHTDDLLTNFSKDERDAFLQKPFTAVALIQKVRSILDCT